MTLLMALVYFFAGILCIHRPALLAEWIGNALKRTGKATAPEWLRGRGTILFIRLIGFLAMFNAIVLFYTALYRNG